MKKGYLSLAAKPQVYVSCLTVDVPDSWYWHELHTDSNHSFPLGKHVITDFRAMLAAHAMLKGSTREINSTTTGTAATASSLQACYDV